jgi:RNA polymerase sigma-70 factor (ECF subfamily)
MTACSEMEHTPTNFKWRESGLSNNQLSPRGSATDFQRIYQLHSREIYSFCLLTVGNKAEAETLMREAFLGLFRQLKTCQRDATLSTVLYRSAISELRRRLRNQQPHCDTSLWTETSQRRDNHDTHEVKLAPDSRTTDIVPWRFAQAIVELPLDLRIVFVLHDVLGNEHTAVAQILKVSADASKSQLYKARLRLRGVLFPVLRTPTENVSTKEGREVV